MSVLQLGYPAIAATILAFLQSWMISVLNLAILLLEPSLLAGCWQCLVISAHNLRGYFCNDPLGGSQLFVILGLSFLVLL